MDRTKNFTCEEAIRFNVNIKKSFVALRRKGYFARMNFWCCQSCAWADVPEGKGDKAVFYHEQDNARIDQDRGVYLAWAGNGAEIKQILEEHGLFVDWDGNEHQRLFVQLAADKPVPPMADADYVERLEVLFS